jgi:catechol 2,3-dioxygenase-like lactoylglutathione lyase family enzyme
MVVHPRAFSHVGITVPDIDKAIEWYGEVLGFTLLAGPMMVLGGEGATGEASGDIFGAAMGSFRLAHMAGANGMGLEVFEFVDPEVEVPEDNFEYWKIGIFHFCVVDSDIEGLAGRIAGAGGKQRSKVWSLAPGKPYKVCYCEDPWGNIVEINSHSYEQTWSNLLDQD